MIKARRNIDKQKLIKSEKSGRVFSDKKQKNKKEIKLSEQWYKSLLESFSRFKKEFSLYQK